MASASATAPVGYGYVSVRREAGPTDVSTGSIELTGSSTRYGSTPLATATFTWSTASSTTGSTGSTESSIAESTDA